MQTKGGALRRLSFQHPSNLSHYAPALLDRDSTYFIPTYFMRYVIRPLLRSYGVISILTLSPVRMRM